MAVSAAIRNKNPGAMWDGVTATRWGSVKHEVLADGQANHIAIFPDNINGACAQFDLWRRNYRNMTLNAAIQKWCGGNSPTTYVGFLTQHTGITGSTMITPELLASERGLQLMKAQANWEAGQPFPMTDAQWKQAQKKVFGTSPSNNTKAATTGGVVVAGGGAAAVAAKSGYNWGAVIGIIAFTIIIAAVVWVVWQRTHVEVIHAPDPLPAPTPSPDPNDPARH